MKKLQILLLLSVCPSIMIWTSDGSDMRNTMVDDPDQSLSPEVSDNWFFEKGEHRLPTAAAGGGAGTVAGVTQQRASGTQDASYMNPELAARQRAFFDDTSDDGIGEPSSSSSRVVLRNPENAEYRFRQDPNEGMAVAGGGRAGSEEWTEDASQIEAKLESEYNSEAMQNAFQVGVYVTPNERYIGILPTGLDLRSFLGEVYSIFERNKNLYKKNQDALKLNEKKYRETVQKALEYFELNYQVQNPGVGREVLTQIINGWDQEARKDPVVQMAIQLDRAERIRRNQWSETDSDEE